MSGVELTCDRAEGKWRVALWQKGELRDLYLCDIENPDLAGAVAGARAVRILPGRKAAWLDAGLKENIYVENPGNIKAGETLMVRITAAARKGKALSGVIVDGETPGRETGIIVKPPRPWQRAITEMKNGRITSMSFAEREDREECREWLEKNAPHLLSALRPAMETGAWPELDDILERLKQRVAVLPCGCSVVIEHTEALTAVDVNGGDDRNALAVNLRAIREIARQIRLRDITGIIVIDAMKMKRREDRAKVLNALSHAVSGDPAEVRVFGITKLGLIELTRSRKVL